MSGSVLNESIGMDALRYRVILEPQGDDGYNVVVPAFPEIHTCGRDRDDALRMARDAIELAILHYRDSGREIPPSDLEDVAIEMVDVHLPAA
jgi:predicted RNase H-like HicB family nuclease